MGGVLPSEWGGGVGKLGWWKELEKGIPGGGGDMSQGLCPELRMFGSSKKSAVAEAWRSLGLALVL